MALPADDKVMHKERREWAGDDHVEIKIDTAVLDELLEPKHVSPMSSVHQRAPEDLALDFNVAQLQHRTGQIPPHPTWLVVMVKP